MLLKSWKFQARIIFTTLFIGKNCSDSSNGSANEIVEENTGDIDESLPAAVFAGRIVPTGQYKIELKIPGMVGKCGQGSTDPESGEFSIELDSAVECQEANKYFVEITDLNVSQL